MRVAPLFLLFVILLLPPQGHGAVSVDHLRIRLVDPTGAVVTLSDITTGHPTILHFWATWCVPCLTELPALAEFFRDLERRGNSGRLVLISVDRGDPDRVRRFLRDRLELTELASYQDRDGASGTAFRLAVFPATVFLDAAGRVTGRVSGSLPWRAPDIHERLKKLSGSTF